MNDGSNVGWIQTDIKVSIEMSNNEMDMVMNVILVSTRWGASFASS